MKLKLLALMFSFVFALDGYAQTQISKWDEQINQWRNESLLLKAEQIPTLEAQARAGDVRAAYLLYLEKGLIRFGYKSGGALNEIGSWILNP